MRRRTELRERRRREKREARDLRRRNELCLCADDERFYPDNSTAALDTEPMKKCEACGKERLIVKVICPAFAQSEIEGVPMAVAARTVFTNILR